MMRNTPEQRITHHVFTLEIVRGIYEIHEHTFFPFDFGLIPATIGDDGDPLDILLFMDETETG